MLPQGKEIFLKLANDRKLVVMNYELYSAIVFIWGLRCASKSSLVAEPSVVVEQHQYINPHDVRCMKTERQVVVIRTACDFFVVR